MKVDLTPAELREFARLCDSEREAWSEMRWDLWKKIRAPGHTFDASLALALADAMAERDEAIKAKNGLVAIVECRDEHIKELMGNSVHADAALDAEGYKRKCEQLEADLEAAREAIRIARKGWFLQLPPHDWAELPAARAAWEKAK